MVEVEASDICLEGVIILRGDRGGSGGLVDQEGDSLTVVAGWTVTDISVSKGEGVLLLWTGCFCFACDRVVLECSDIF